MSDIFGVHDEALLVRNQRAKVLANNIVNADTPGYKATDIDFKVALSQALDMPKGQDNKVKGLSHIFDPEFGAAMRYRLNVQPSLDGNTVDSNVEKAQYMRNAQRMQATMRFLEDRISGIRRALRGE